MGISDGNRLCVQVELSVDWLDSILVRAFEVSKLVAAIRRDTASILQMLGLEGSPDVNVTFEREGSVSANRPVSISVDGAWCPVPLDVWRTAWAHFSRSEDQGRRDPADIVHALCSNKFPSSSIDLSGLLAMVCRATLSRQPSVLLTSTTFARYLERLGPYLETRHGYWQTRIKWILEEVLHLGISIDDVEEVGFVIAEGQRSEISAIFDYELVEQLIEQLRPRSVRIFASRATLRGLTEYLDSVAPAQRFALIRDEMYRRCGIDVSSFRLVEDEASSGHTLAFSVNNLKSLPVLAADPPSIMQSIIHHLIVEAPRLINTANVADLLSTVAEMFPTLVADLKDAYSTAHVASGLRQLVRDGVSLRPIRPIFEAMVDYGYAVGDTSAVSTEDLLVLSRAVTDEELVSLRLSVARARLRVRSDFLATCFGLGGRPRLILTIDRELEEELRNIFWTAGCRVERQFGGRRHQAFLDATYRLLASSTMTDDWDAVCFAVGTEAQPGLRELLRLELPSVRVLTHQELRPTTAADLQRAPPVMLKWH